MALAMRLSRGGRKHRPFYRIVVADKRMPRDGRYIERLGTYNPLLANDDEQRVVLNKERIEYWLGQGAVPSKRVQLFLAKEGMADKPEIRETPKKSAPSEKTQERIREKEEKKAAAAEAAKAEAEAPKEEAPAEEAAAPAEGDAPAEEAKTEDAAPAEEAKEEAPAEEKPAEEPKAEDKPEEKAGEAPKEEAKAEEPAAEEGKEEEKKEG